MRQDTCAHPVVFPDAERIAQAFHDTYARYAALHGRNVDGWAYQPDSERLLVVDTIEHLLARGIIREGAAPDRLREGPD